MNILDLKRKALGHHLRSDDSEGGDSAPNVGGWGGDTPSYTGGNTPTMADPNQGPPAPSMADPNEGPQQAPSPGYYGWSSGGDFYNSAPTTADAQQYASPMGVPNEGPPKPTMGDPNEGPQYKSLAERLGVKFGVSKDDYFNNRTTYERDDAMGLVGDALNRAGQIAISAVPGGSAMMTIGKALDAMDKGMSFADAAKAAAFGIGGGLVAGKINSAVGQALGPDVSKAIGTYNQFGSLANLANPGSVPAFNPGSQAVGYARDAFGVPSLGAPSGMTTPSGDPVQSYGGWSSGSSGGGGSSGVPDSLPQAPQAAQPMLSAPINGQLGNVTEWFRKGQGTLKKGN